MYAVMTFLSNVIKGYFPKAGFMSLVFNVWKSLLNKSVSVVVHIRKSSNLIASPLEYAPPSNKRPSNRPKFKISAPSPPHLKKVEDSNYL